MVAHIDFLFWKNAMTIYNAKLVSWNVIQLVYVAGVSECIIMGIPMSIGTGLFKLLQKYPFINACKL